MIKIIIFDLGNVVFNENWEGINDECVKKFGISTLIRSSYGQEIQKVYDDALIGKKSMRDVFNKICETKGLKIDTNRLCDFYKKAYKRNKKINEEVICLIRKLKKRFKLVCLTDTNELHFKSHQEQGILELFDETFCSCQLGMRKKDKTVFKIILNKLHSKPEEVLFIDNNLKNIENAHSVGINVIQFKKNNQFIKEIQHFLKNQD